MGFTINQTIQSDHGYSITGAYTTINGTYSVRKVPILDHNPDPQFLIDNGFNLSVTGYRYLLGAVINIYVVRGATLPIYSYNLESEIIDYETTSYDVVYTRVKDEVKIRLNNPLLTFTNE